MTQGLPPLASAIRAWVEPRIGSGETGPPCLLVVPGNYGALGGQLTETFSSDATVLRWKPEATERGRRPQADPDWTEATISLLISIVDVVLPRAGPPLKALEILRQRHVNRGAVFDRVAALEARVRQQPPERPLVAYLADIDGDADAWATLSYVARLLGEGRVRARVCLVASAGSARAICGPDPAQLDADASDPFLVELARSVERREADLVDPGHLDDRRTWAWLGRIDDDLVRLLVSMSGGDDQAASDLWRYWLKTEFVEKRLGSWAPTPGVTEPLSLMLDDAKAARLPHDRRRRRLADSALRVAALYGREFSGSVVARVAAAEEGDVSADDIEDVLDRLVPDDDGVPWLLDTIGHSRKGGDPLWRYEFESPLLAAWLQATADPALLQPLFDETKVLHEQDPQFLDDLISLASRAGRSREWTRFRNQRRTADRLDRLEVHARVLLATTSPATRDPRLTADATETTNDMEQSRTEAYLAADLGQRAVELAETCRSPTLLDHALLAAGRTAWTAGRFETSILYFRRLLVTSQARFEAGATPDARRSLAIVQYELGSRLAERGDTDEGISLLRHALDHNTALYRDDPTPAPAATFPSPSTSWAAVWPSGATPTKASASSATPSPTTPLSTWTTPPRRPPQPFHHPVRAGPPSGRPGRHRRRHQPPPPRPHPRHRPLPGRPTPAARRNLVVTQRALGRRLADRGDTDEGISLLRHALDHRTALYRDDPTPDARRDLSITQYELGRRLADRGDTDEGIGLLRHALDHQTALSDDDPTPDARRRLSETQRELGSWTNERDDDE